MRLPTGQNGSEYAENPGIIYHAGTRSISTIKMKGSDNFQTAYLELEGFLNGYSTDKT